jgi:hypothetical protein
MNIVYLQSAHEWIKYPAFYNINSIRNEISSSAGISTNKLSKKSDFFIDTCYGKIYNNSKKAIEGLYGISSNMKYYFNNKELELVNELRVPFRKIPIYRVSKIKEIQDVISIIKKENPDYEILIRGQTKNYLLTRTDEEKQLFYGSTDIKEPSFLPSYLRKNFNEIFLQSMWNNKASDLFNDIGFNYSKTLPEEKFSVYKKDINYIKNTCLMTPFSLGIAQHYGMPSVGLDLTSDLDVANWFASNSMNIGPSGSTTTKKVDSTQHKSSMIYIFRCPKDIVFDYQIVKPKVFPISRPDMQSAWFGHVGWGAASNQLASYLVCAFELSKEYLDNITTNLERKLFPSIEDDPILEYFLREKNKTYYEGDVKKVLETIYYLET